MRKWIAWVLCIVIAASVLAGCQSETDVPYVTGEGLQGNVQNPNHTDPQDGQQATQPNQGGQQTTQPNQGGQQATQPNQGGQQATQPNQGGQQTTQPNQGGQQTTQPSQGGQQNTQPAQTEPDDFVLPKPEDCTYEQYMAMTGEQQEQFFNQFNGDFAAFFAWLDAAKAEYDANSNDIELDPDATIDLDDIFGNKE